MRCDGSFETLKVTKVNTYGIVLHWQGSDKAALPVLMAAHQGELLLRYCCC